MPIATGATSADSANPSVSCARTRPATPSASSLLASLNEQHEVVGSKAREHIASATRASQHARDGREHVIRAGLAAAAA